MMKLIYKIHMNHSYIIDRGSLVLHM